MELGCGKGVRFICKEEMLTKAPCAESANSVKIPINVDGTQVSVMPDAIFGLEYPGQAYRFFALEADRATMPIVRKNLAHTSYHRKLLGYRQILLREAYRTRWGVPNLIVLNVMTCSERMRHIMGDLKQVTDEKESAAFLFKMMKGDIWTAPPANGHMMLEAWLRVGHTPFSICTL